MRINTKQGGQLLPCRLYKLYIKEKNKGGVKVMLKDLLMILNETGLYFLKLSMFIGLGSCGVFTFLHSNKGKNLINKFM